MAELIKNKTINKGNAYIILYKINNIIYLIDKKNKE